LIHDWKDHADESVRKTLKSRGLEVFENDSGKVENSSRIVSPALAFPSLSFPEPIPVPKPVSPAAAEPIDSWFLEWYEQIYQRHPRKTGKARARSIFERLLAQSPNPVEQAEAISRKHAIWCDSPDWQKEAGRFAPALINWALDGWQDDPPAVEPNPYTSAIELRKKLEAKPQ
jgi:hypothetical protein